MNPKSRRLSWIHGAVAVVLASPPGCKRDATAASAAPVPLGHWEGVCGGTRFRTTGPTRYPSNPCSFGVAPGPDGRPRGLLRAPGYGLVCEGTATRVNEQLVVAAPTCRHDWSATCPAQGAMITFGIEPSGDLMMRPFAAAFPADAPACQESRVAVAGERVEIEPGPMRRGAAAP